MIRLGVVGYGKRMQSLVDLVFRPIEPDIKVAAVVDSDEKGAAHRLAESDQKDVVFYSSLKEMVRHARLDALAIGSRCNTHASYAIQASEYDIPLYLEKPVAISMEQAASLEKAFAKSKCQVVVSFPLRVSPLCVLAKERIDKGAVGRCDHIAAANYVPYGTVYWEEDYRNYEMTQGLFIQKATHDFDYMSYLMGSPIVRVAAMSTIGKIFGGDKPAGLNCAKCRESYTCPESPENRKRNNSGGILEDHPCLFSIDCGSPETGMNEDSSSALVEFASGAHGVYTQVFFTRRDAAKREAVISGYEGTISFDWYTNELRRVRHHQPFTETIQIGKGLSHFGGDHELARDFINIIRGKGKSRNYHPGRYSERLCMPGSKRVN